MSDPASDTALYDFDAVGNLLSIRRQSSSTLAVIHFAPKAAPVGAVVTISGTAFSATASENVVHFNGTQASVTSASPSRLLVAVPVGATSGAITVATPTASTTAAGSFTVTPAPAPTIASFSPAVAAVGSAVTLTGTNFEPVLVENVAAVNTMRALVTQANATSLTMTVPTAASGRWRYARPQARPSRAISSSRRPGSRRATCS